MTALTVEERDVLAELMEAAVAPHLIRAVHAQDAGAVEELLAGLEWQDLAALTVALAVAVEVGA